MLPISYGAMLVETLVAILALIAVGSLAHGGVLPKQSPPVVFAMGVSGFLSQIGLPYNVSFTIVSLAVSSFILTTLDAVARLGRLSFQELFSAENEGPSKNPILRVMQSKTAASVFTLVPAFMLATMGYQTIWALFGSANQLLAALTLIACTMFFKKTGRRIIMLVIPTVIMLVVTFSSLVLAIRWRLVLIMQSSENSTVLVMQTAIAALLLILGIMVAVSCTKKLLEKKSEVTVTQ